MKENRLHRLWQKTNESFSEKRPLFIAPSEQPKGNPDSFQEAKDWLQYAKEITDAAGQGGGDILLKLPQSFLENDGRVTAQEMEQLRHVVQDILIQQGETSDNLRKMQEHFRALTSDSNALLDLLVESQLISGSSIARIMQSRGASSQENPYGVSSRYHSENLADKSEEELLADIEDAKRDINEFNRERSRIVNQYRYRRSGVRSGNRGQRAAMRQELTYQMGDEIRAARDSMGDPQARYWEARRAYEAKSRMSYSAYLQRDKLPADLMAGSPEEGKKFIIVDKNNTDPDGYGRNIGIFDTWTGSFIGTGKMTREKAIAIFRSQKDSGADVDAKTREFGVDGGEYLPPKMPDPDSPAQKKKWAKAMRDLHNPLAHEKYRQDAIARGAMGDKLWNEIQESKEASRKLRESIPTYQVLGPKPQDRINSSKERQYKEPQFVRSQLRKVEAKLYAENFVIKQEFGGIRIFDKSDEKNARFVVSADTTKNEAGDIIPSYHVLDLRNQKRYSFAEEQAMIDSGKKYSDIVGEGVIAKDFTTADEVVAYMRTPAQTPEPIPTAPVTPEPVQEQRELQPAEISEIVRGTPFAIDTSSISKVSTHLFTQQNATQEQLQVVQQQMQKLTDTTTPILSVSERAGKISNVRLEVTKAVPEVELELNKYKGVPFTKEQLLKLHDDVSQALLRAIKRIEQDESPSSTPEPTPPTEEPTPEPIPPTEESTPEPTPPADATPEPTPPTEESTPEPTPPADATREPIPPNEEPQMWNSGEVAEDDKKFMSDFADNTYFEMTEFDQKPYLSKALGDKEAVLPMYNKQYGTAYPRLHLQVKDGKISETIFHAKDAKIPAPVAELLKNAIGKDLTEETAMQLGSDIDDAFIKEMNLTPDQKLMSDLADNTYFEIVERDQQLYLSKQMGEKATVVPLYRKLYETYYPRLYLQVKDGKISEAIFHAKDAEVPAPVAELLKNAIGKDLTEETAMQLGSDIDDAFIKEMNLTPDQQFMSDFADKSSFEMTEFDQKLYLSKALGDKEVVLSQYNKLFGRSYPRLYLQVKDGKISEAIFHAKDAEIPTTVAELLKNAIGKDLTEETAMQLGSDIDNAFEVELNKEKLSDEDGESAAAETFQGQAFASVPPEDLSGEVSKNDDTQSPVDDPFASQSFESVPYDEVPDRALGRTDQLPEAERASRHREGNKASRITIPAERTIDGKPVDVVIEPTKDKTFWSPSGARAAEHAGIEVDVQLDGRQRVQGYDVHYTKSGLFQQDGEVVAAGRDKQAEWAAETATRTPERANAYFDIDLGKNAPRYFQLEMDNGETYNIDPKAASADKLMHALKGISISRNPGSAHNYRIHFFDAGHLIVRGWFDRGGNLAFSKNFNVVAKGDTTEVPKAEATNVRNETWFPGRNQ